MLTYDRNKIISIDGLTGSGKSEVALKLAKTLRWRHVNLDLILRKLSQACFARETNPNDIEMVAPIISQCLSNIEAIISGIDTSEKITSPAWDSVIRRGAYVLADNSAYINEAIRDWLIQHLSLQTEGIVIDGYGSTLKTFLPQVCMRVFLSAPLRVRAYRRLSMQNITVQKNDFNTMTVSFNTMLASIKIEEEGREEKIMAPHGLPEGVFRIDTSELSIDNIARMIWRIQEDKLRIDSMCV